MPKRSATTAAMINGQYCCSHEKDVGHSLVAERPRRPVLRLSIVFDFIASPVLSTIHDKTVCEELATMDNTCW